MKIIADSAIPYIAGVLDPYAEVHMIAGIDIDASDVRDADAMIIRTRTQCNARLLEGSRVKFIVTATIGVDHIDTDYCRRRGIEVVSCAGCNARGVLQYIASALVMLSRRDGWQPAEKMLGIVGVGHVGSLVKEYAEAWGFRTVCCDPPRERLEHLGFADLGDIAAKADIITLHTPLDDSTRHLVDNSFLALTRKECVIINSSRGEVVDTAALACSGRRYILDVWEKEPAIDPAITATALAATPHIAGYSAQGKANASSMAVNALARRFSLPIEGWYPSEKVQHCEPVAISWQELCSSINDYFDIEVESNRLKGNVADFEAIRNCYPYRDEYF